MKNATKNKDIHQQMIDDGYADGKKSFEYYHSQIYDNFNWERVHKAMIAAEWYWSLGQDKNGNSKMGIPSFVTIQNMAYVLLKEAYDSGNQISSGGFTAGWDEGELYLSFTLEEKSAG